MTDEPAAVFVVDDDPSVLRALTRLLSAAGYRVRAFPSSRDFLAAHDAATPGCVLLDLAMPGLSGLELQQELWSSGCQRPIVFVSGHGDIPSSVSAMKAGAVDFLTKPVSEEDLRAAIRRAIEQDHTMRRARAEVQAIGARLATLTPREREVLRYVVAGRLNKQIATDFGTVEKTVKVHRARMMKKMGVRSITDLVRMTERVEIAAAAPQRALPVVRTEAIPR